MYKIFARKENKAFCYSVDSVEPSIIVDDAYSYRDLKDNTFHTCSKDAIVENPTFTGREFHGYKEIVLA